MIRLTRIDYRLLHGQVAFAWCNFLSANCILIANDDIAENESRKSMLRLAKPSECKLVFKSIDDSISAINSGATDKYKLFIVVETIDDAKKLCDGCAKVREVNLGLSKKKENSKSLDGAAVYADERELSLLREMSDKGISIFIQQGPTDKLINIKNCF